MATLSEVDKCPTCGSHGVQTGSRSNNDGTRLLQFNCKSVLCPDNDLGWVVTQYADGTFPDKKSPLLKAYPNMGKASNSVKDMVNEAKLRSRR